MLGLLPRAAGASPGEDDAFRALHDRALQLYQNRRFEEAIAALEAAYAMRPDPRLRLNLGHACRRLGRTEEALRHYQRYRDEMPNLAPAEVAAVEEYMDLARQAAPPRAPATQEPPPPTAGGPASAPREPPAPREPARPPAPTPAPRAPPVTLRLVQPPPPAPPLYRRWWFWGVLGAVAAGAVTAAVVSTQPWDASLNLPPGVRIHDPKF